jgi:hypothetical protein
MNRRPILFGAASLTAVLALVLALGLASQLRAYPGGTPRFVTNAAPYCTSCHSSTSLDQLREMPADAASHLLPEQRHYPEIANGEERYATLQPADREKLLAAVKAMDANCRVTLTASATKLKRLAPLTVTVTTRGGAGPVIGVMLTDNDFRYQSSPVQVEGFLITAAPQVTGPDGKPQTQFLDGRAKELTRNINYVNIDGVKSDPDAGVYPECKVVYTLKAPALPGEYTISAAFLYGTEKASPLGRVEAPGGRVLPLGGQGAASGRVQFAKPLRITVS